jgi:Protein of unknown function (DUF1449)
MLFDLSNLPYWILLGAGILLFLFIVVSGTGDDDVDIDTDADVDVDVDADVHHTPLHIDTEVDGDGSFSVASLLGWFGVGKAPLLLLIAMDLSLWGLLGWGLNVAIADSLGNLISGILTGFIFLGSMVLAFVIGGQISRPIGQLFAAFGEDASADRLVGCLGTVSTGKIPLLSEGKIGQVDVLDPAKNLVTVNAVLPNWAVVVPQRGEKVLVIERSNSVYCVVVKDSADQDNWFTNSSRLKDSR